MILWDDGFLLPQELCFCSCYLSWMGKKNVLPVEFLFICIHFGEAGGSVKDVCGWVCSCLVSWNLLTTG
jgi:hypothetical protein